MRVKIFTINCHESEQELLSLNQFLVNNKILDVKRKFFKNKENAYWSFCIRYIELKNTSNDLFSKKKIDYKEILNEEQFGKFSRLREIRKLIAQEEAIPAYAIFTDEELSEISKLEILNEFEIMKIKGIGEKKVSKYGVKMIEIFENKI